MKTGLKIIKFMKNLILLSIIAFTLNSCSNGEEVTEVVDVVVVEDTLQSVDSTIVEVDTNAVDTCCSTN
jgi:PBP1b-binding outer membrane lipoprotein LpoB